MPRRTAPTTRGPSLPPLAPVRVAVIDSGVDGTHPEFRDADRRREELRRRPADRRHAGARHLRRRPDRGQADDGIGIAGLARPPQLLVAKVVGPQRTIPVEAEAKAIRWAVASGARVINMSLGGLRDPLDPNRDTYSQARGRRRRLRRLEGRRSSSRPSATATRRRREPWHYAS